MALDLDLDLDSIYRATSTNFSSLRGNQSHVHVHVQVRIRSPVVVPRANNQSSINHSSLIRSSRTGALSTIDKDFLSERATWKDFKLDTLAPQRGPMAAQNGFIGEDDEYEYATGHDAEQERTVSDGECVATKDSRQTFRWRRI